MLKKLSRPHTYFLLTGFLFLAACLIIGNQSLDVNVHDTYFIIAYSHVGIAFFLIYAFYAGMYFLMRKQNHAVLSLLHFILTLPLVVVLYLHTFFMFGSIPRRYYTNGDVEFINFTFLNDPRETVFCLFLIGHLFLVANIVVSLIRAFKSRT